MHCPATGTPLPKTLRKTAPAGNHWQVTSPPRPLLHFTAQRGYTNDPHGVVHVDGGYHMFFQHNPDALVHTPHVSWGHAVSPDLISWEELTPALVPINEEVGCWSGSTVLTSDGPVIAYTRIATDDWDQGQVALARPSADMNTWLRDPGPPVVGGPPNSPNIVAFRDPQIRAEGAAWKAVIGGGLPGYGGCALQYDVSPDLGRWTFEGVLASRSADESAPIPTGTVWECPQFLNVDGRWVLIVSVWEAGQGMFVAYAIGEFDGQRFTPEAWGRFAHDDLQYATTTFADADGRPCAMSWLRESPDLPVDHPSPWRSAMTLPVELAVSDGHLVGAFHRNLQQLFDERALAPTSGGHYEAPLPPDGLPWRLRVAGAEVLEIAVADERGFSWQLTVDPTKASVRFEDARSGEVQSWPLHTAGAYEADVIADGDIVEVACGQAGGVFAARTRRTHSHASVRIRTVPPGRVSLGWWREP